MKKISVLVALLIVTTILANSQSFVKNAAVPVANEKEWPGPSSDINTKAVRNFYKTYGDANHETWYNTSYGSRAKCNREGVAIMADYNTKGGWIRSIQTFREEKLDPAIRKRIKSKYFDYQIGWIKEINSPIETVYLVTIEDASSWMVLTLAGEEMAEGQVFKKSL